MLLLNAPTGVCRSCAMFVEAIRTKFVVDALAKLIVVGVAKVKQGYTSGKAAGSFEREKQYRIIH